jgi:hypothetical protein
MLQMAVEEIARACASSALILMVQELGTLPIRCSAATSRSRSGCRAAPAASGRPRSRCPSPRPAPTRRRCAPPRSRTATSGSSTAPRTGSPTPAIADFYVVFAKTDRENNRHQRVHRREGPRGLLGRQARAQARHPRLADRRAGLRRRARARREPDRRGGQGHERRARHARAHAPRRRRRRPSASRRARPTTPPPTPRSASRSASRSTDLQAIQFKLADMETRDGRRARAALQGLRDGRPQRAPRTSASTRRWRSSSPPTPR